MAASPRPIHNESGLRPPVIDAVRQAVQTHARLTTVFEWLATRKPRTLPVATVAQDEFTHDVVVQFREGVFLAYDVT